METVFGDSTHQKANEKEELKYDEETGKLKKDVETKHIKVSKTDPESGCFHKGEKEKCGTMSRFRTTKI